MEKNKGISDEGTGKSSKKPINRVKTGEVKVLQAQLELAEYELVAANAKILGVTVSKFARGRILNIVDEDSVEAKFKAAVIKISKEIEEKLNEKYQEQYKKLTDELNQKYKDTITGEILKGVQAVIASMSVDEFVVYQSVCKKLTLNPVLAELNFDTDEEELKLLLNKTRED